MNIHQGTRIAFTGAGSTGKTTSAEVVSVAFDLPLIKSASRTVYEEQNLTEELVSKMSPKEKLELQLRIFDEKIKRDRQYSYVADRTILDHYVYCLAYCGAFMDNDKFLKYENKVRSLMLSTYSHIFYFAWGYWEPEDDGVRQSRYSWQSMIDAIIVGYLVRWNLSVIHVPQTRGLEYRNDYIISCVKGEIRNAV